MIRNDKHLFTCPLNIYISSLEKCLFRSSVHFLIRLIVFFIFKFVYFLIEGQLLYRIVLVRAKHQHNVLDSE